MAAAIPVEPKTTDFGKVRIMADGTVTAGYFVVLSATGVEHAANTCTTGVFGIALTGGADAEAVVIATKGVFTVDLASGFDPAMGDVCYLSDPDEVDAGTAGDFGVGVIVGLATGGSGTTASMLLTANQANVGIAKP